MSHLSRLAVLVAVATAAPSSAFAIISFTPVAPATCPAQTEVNWNYNVGNVGTGTWMVANDENDPSVYANNLNYITEVTANELVNGIGFRFQSFGIEKNFDFFNLYAFQGPNQNLVEVSETDTLPANTWVDMHVPTAIGAPLNDVLLQFTTDYSNGGPGIAIDRARVCTDNPWRPLTYQGTNVGAGERYTGVLLGTNDVVRFTMPVGSTKSGDTCTKAHDTFALIGDTSPGNDFDLYVRCGADPTPTQWDFRGFSSLPQEYIHATNVTCPCGSSWHVAVHSFNGSGFFNFYNHKHYASEHRSNLTASVLCNAPSAQVNQYQSELTRGMRYFYGTNEGTRFWDNYTLTNNNLINNSDIWYYCSNGRPSSDLCGPGPGSWLCSFEQCQVYMYQDWFDGATLTHEISHHVNCIAEEYADGDGAGTVQCGHSVMASQWFQNTNYCYCNNQPSGQNKCAYQAGDHGWDPVPITLTHEQSGTAWINLAPRSPISVTSTPDNYDFNDFLFGNLYAFPIIH
jgi:hypothetical protein